MTVREKRLRAAEELVRTVLSRDLKQEVPADVVTSVARKVARAIPTTTQHREKVAA